MPYTVHRDDDILHVKVIDHLTDEDLESYIVEVQEILATIPDGEQIKAFIDMLDLAKVNPNIRHSAGQFMQDPKFGKTAVLGNSRVIKVMIDFLLKASGRHHIKYFKEQNEALEWLND